MVNGAEPLPGIPMDATDMEHGLDSLVGRLNTPESEYRAAIELDSSRWRVRGVSAPAERKSSWRGRRMAGAARRVRGRATGPIGAPRPSARSRTCHGRGVQTPADRQRPRWLGTAGLTDFAFSTYDYGIGDAAGTGPERPPPNHRRRGRRLRRRRLRRPVRAAMAPGLTGDIT